VTHGDPPTLHRILDGDDRDDAQLLDSLRRDDAIEFADSWAAQSRALGALRPEPDSELLAESPRWIYYPWRRAVVKVLGPRSFRRLRLDRNRNLITTRLRPKVSAVVESARNASPLPVAVMEGNVWAHG
jgi:hypothetical protein